MTRIDTVDQLDALPIGSIVMDRHGYPWLRQTESWVCTRDSGVIEPHEAGPHALLHVPGRDLVQAQADAWDEGYQAGLDDAHDHALGLTAGRPNPYRDEEP